MNFYVIRSCFFKRIKLRNPTTGELIPGSERGYGFFARETDYGAQPDYQQCSYYHEDEIDKVFDGWMKMGRFCGIIAGRIGLIAFVIMLTTCCISYSDAMYERWLLWAYLIAAALTGLSFLIFGSELCSENRCKIADGGGYAISTFFMFLMAANSVKSMGGSVREISNKNKDGKKRGDDAEHLWFEEDDNLWYDEGTDPYEPKPRNRGDEEAKEEILADDGYSGDQERDGLMRPKNDGPEPYPGAAASDDEDDDEKPPPVPALPYYGAEYGQPAPRDSDSEDDRRPTYA